MSVQLETTKESNKTAKKPSISLLFLCPKLRCKVCNAFELASFLDLHNTIGDLRDLLEAHIQIEKKKED